MDWQGLGIEKIWGLPESHVFHEAAVKHDTAYDERRAGLLNDKTSSLVDTRFLLDCLEKAGSSLWLKAQAYFFYSLTRAWGFLNWPIPITQEPPINPD